MNKEQSLSELQREETEKEFAKWKNLSDGIPGHWREDERYRQHKDGTMYYIGGESGQYMRITNDGTLMVGIYDLAKPGIEDAVLTIHAAQKYGSYEQAFLAASDLAGLRFRADIFQEKPSVMEQIREARKAPPAPHKQKDGHGRGEPGL